MNQTSATSSSRGSVASAQSTKLCHNIVTMYKKESDMPEEQDEVDFNPEEYKELWTRATLKVANEMGQLYQATGVDILACGFICGISALLYNARKADEPYVTVLERYLERIKSATESFIVGVKSSSPDYPYLKYMSPEEIEDIVKVKFM